jgi:hypothetical protein
MTRLCFLFSIVATPRDTAELAGSNDARKGDGMSARAVERNGSGTWTAIVQQWRRLAWVVLLVADTGLFAWGVGAAAIPEHLLGPGGVPILTAGYEGYTGGSWHELVATSPKTAGYITLVFRMYGLYIVAFSLLAIAIAVTAFRRGEHWAWWALLVGNTVAFVSAMTYDRIVGAIGPFEWSEYLGLALIYGSLGITAPWLSGERAVQSGAASRFRPGIEERQAFRQ